MKKINLKVTADQYIMLYNLIRSAKSCPIAECGKGVYRMDLYMIIDETERNTLMNFEVLGSI